MERLLTRAVAVALIATSVLIAGCDEQQAAQQVPPVADIPPPVWAVSEPVDRITGKASAIVTQSAKGGDFKVQLECSGGRPSVSLWGDRFYPHMVGSSEYYLVSYRFDSKPGVQLENWNGLDHWASPPDEMAFLREMLSSKTLFVRVAGTAMETFEGEFDLSGLEPALTASRKLCSGLPEAVRTSTAAQ